MQGIDDTATVGRAILEEHDRPPSALRFTLRAARPYTGLPADGSFPAIIARWRGLKLDAAHRDAFCATTGLCDLHATSVLYPHVLGFRLQMALLTHPAYPLPIWNALQIRNRLVQHRYIEHGAVLDLETRIGAHRVVEKGVEVDLLSRLTSATELCWESAVTFYYRGRFGGVTSDRPRSASPDLSQAVVVDGFRIPRGGGWQFGQLSGDYNGIHLWTPYAKLFGFPAAFPQPQRVVGMCLARLKGPESESQTLELWIKGPVFYGANTVLSSLPCESGTVFGLALEGDSRHAIVGRWSRGERAG